MRITFARMAGFAACVLACAAHGGQAVWPPQDRAVQIIVPAPPDTGISTKLASLVARELGQRLGGSFAMARSNGIHGHGAAAIVASAPPDGGTLLLCDTKLLTINPILYRELPAEVGSMSLAPIGLVAQMPNILVVSNSLPVSDLASFTDYVRRNPGIVNFGSTGNGSVMHLAGQLYMSATDTNMVHIAYRSAAQANSNLVTGEIQSMFQLVPGVLDQVRQHQIKALGVMSDHRVQALPEVPTMAEQGHPELKASAWLALMAPPNTPVEIIERANKALNATLADPAVRKEIVDMGAEPGGGSPADLKKLLASERKKWRSIITDADVSGAL